MAETLPMLETDPRRRFNTSRLLRVLVFSFVASVVIVSLLIVFVRFVWDEIVAPTINWGNYNANPLLVLPAIVVITALMAKVLWDIAEQKPAPPRKR